MLFKNKGKKPVGEDPHKMALRVLQSLLEGTVRKEDAVCHPEEEWRITVGVSRCEGEFASFYFWVEHPRLDEPFYDMSAGVGHTMGEAVEQAVASFVYSAMQDLRRCLAGTFDEELTVPFLGRDCHWQVSTGNLVCIGAKDAPAVNLWELLKDLVPHHLGNRRVMWVKAYLSRQGSGEVVCECRVNEMVSEELTAPLIKVAEGWNGDTFRSQKQFFFLCQREEAYIPLPFTRDQLFSYVDEAVPIVAAGEDEDGEDRRLEQLTTITGNRTLAAELQSFLPEICAMNAFHEAHYGEKLMVALSLSGKPSEFYLDQLAAYRWMQQAVLMGFSKGRYDPEDYKRLIYQSATCNALNNALRDGSKLEDMVLAGLIYQLPDETEVY